MPTDQFLQVKLHFGAPCLNRGFLRTFPACHMTCHTTAVRGLIRCRMTELDTFILRCRYRRLERQTSG